MNHKCLPCRCSVQAEDCDSNSTGMRALLVVLLAGLTGAQNQQAESIQRYLLDSPYNLCRQPLFFASNVTATSYWHDRTPQVTNGYNLILKVKHGFFKFIFHL